jgi:hypothetical protein
MTRDRSFKRLVDDQDRAPGEQARVAGMQARVGLTFDLARHVFGQHEQHRRGHLAGHLAGVKGHQRRVERDAGAAVKQVGVRPLAVLAATVAAFALGGIAPGVRWAQGA